MKIKWEKSGGLAAGIRRQPRTLNSAKLSRAAAEELGRLVEAATTESPPPTTGPGRVRDGMDYTITVEDDGKTTEMCQSDGAMTEAFAGLSNWLDRHSAGH